MTTIYQRFIRLVFLACLCSSMPVMALDFQQMQQLVAEDNEVRISQVNQLLAAKDASAKPFMQQILDGNVLLADQRILINGDQVIDIATQQAVALPENTSEVVNNNRMRNMLEGAIAALSLSEGDEAQRLATAQTLQQSDPVKSMLPLLMDAQQKENSVAIKTLLAEIRSEIILRNGDKQERIDAVANLLDSSAAGTKALLASRLEPDAEVDPEVRSAIELAIKKIEQKQVYFDMLGSVFSGISLGSILLLAALGLAITYGLMGVINMAHGEMIMLGAYATFVVQNLFRQYFPAYFDLYVLAALPVAFIFTALIGMAMERTVIRHLYGRPLETLLATWGISLILMQLVRTLFGAQNVSVENPSWMSGGIQVASNLVLPWNRIDIIVFAFLVLLLSWLLLNKTRLGLYVRAVTQNRTMAGCVGVNTNKIDAWAFGLGSGIAGLAGVALAQIGNVGPDLGQSYIVDSFMVVVLGGVGQLAGAVYAALGLGVLTKLFEGFAGAVLAKIIILVLIIIFIQKRPQGLFALKGRNVD